MIKSAIQIRRYQASDAAFLCQIYYNTIHTINAKHYTQDQLDAWAAAASLDPQNWQEKWVKLLPWVATINNVIVGFAEFEPTGHIDCFYVHHEFQSCGVGTALMYKIEEEAEEKLIPRIDAEVSITAKPFFEAMGFTVIKQQTVVLRGVKLINFAMEKRIEKCQN